MAARYDLESLLADLKTTIADSLTAKLSSIDTEKNDGITLAPVNASAYFMQTLDDTAVNYNPMILIGAEDIAGRGIGPATAHDFTLAVVIVVADTGERDKMWRRMFRYQRAIREILETNFSAPGLTKFVITPQPPVDFQFLNSTQPYRAIGIRIATSLVP